MTEQSLVAHHRTVTLDAMHAVIISVGTELVIGQTVDTNSAWLAEQLTRLGVGVIRHTTLGDDAARLSSAIRHGLEDAPLVLVTGGLGPTADDLTRQAVADAIGEPLEEDADALTQVRGYFERWQRPMPDFNRRQALLPRGCAVVPNLRGTAPGISFDRGGRRLFALPGVPSEMTAMFERSLRPAIRRSTGTAGTCAVALHCFGISEAKLGDALADLMVRGRNPLVGTTASEAVLTVRIVARGSDDAVARALADADARVVRERLKHHVFGEGDDTLEFVVGRMLAERGQTVATAESCTGGLLGARFTEVPGSSAYYVQGYVTYANRAKTEQLNVPERVLVEHGAVSEPVARAMAETCRRAARTGFALSVTGIAGPDGGSPPDKPVGLVFIAIADRDGTTVKRFLFGDHLTRREIRDRSCKAALNLLRLKLLGVSAGPV